MPGPTDALTKPYRITLTGIQWLALHGNAALGLKHPQNTGGSSRPFCEEALKEILEVLRNTGCLTIQEYIRALNDNGVEKS